MTAEGCQARPLKADIRVMPLMFREHQQTTSAHTRDMASSSSRHAGVIGAGFAGIAAARTLKQFGWSVTIFEKE